MNQKISSIPFFKIWNTTPILLALICFIRSVKGFQLKYKQILRLLLLKTCIYRISSYCFRRKYSFLNLETQRSQYIRPKVTVHKGAETVQGRKLFKGGNYMRKYGR